MKKIPSHYLTHDSHPMLDLLALSLSALGLFMAAAYLILFYC